MVAKWKWAGVKCQTRTAQVKHSRCWQTADLEKPVLKPTEFSKQIKRNVHVNLSLKWILQLFWHHVLEPELPKNCDSHIDASLSRQPLVKGERLVRYEVNAAISSWSCCNHIFSFYTKSCHAIWNEKKNQTQTCMHPASSRKRTSAIPILMHWLQKETGRLC